MSTKITTINPMSGRIVHEPRLDPPEPSPADLRAAAEQAQRETAQSLLLHTLVDGVNDTAGYFDFYRGPLTSLVSRIRVEINFSEDDTLDANLRHLSIVFGRLQSECGRLANDELFSRKCRQAMERERTEAGKAARS